MGSPEKIVTISESNKDCETNSEKTEIKTEDVDKSVNEISDKTLNESGGQNVSETSITKESDGSLSNSTKKTKKKFRHGKKGHTPSKDNTERNTVRRVHYAAAKFKQGRKRAQSFPTISKFFLPYKRPRKEAFIPPTKFLLGGNISDPLNLNSLQDEDINRAMNAVTPESSPLPTPPRHKAKIDVIIPPNIHDPLNLMEPLDNDEYEKRLQMQQQRKPRNRPKLRRRTTDTVTVQATQEPTEKTDEIKMKEPPIPEPSTSSAKSRRRSCSESENALKAKENKKLRRMDSLDKIVSPVVPQPGAWMRARPQARPPVTERPVSPHRTKPSTSTEEEKQLPKFHPKNTKYQYGNYDRYYGYRNLNAMMDVRLQVFEMHKHLFNNKDILDIGCNVGHISIAVSRTLGARSVLGIDIDPVLIGRARKNLRSFVPVPVEEKPEEAKVEGEEEKKVDCDQCTETKCEDCTTESKDKVDDEKKPHGKKVRRPRKNRKAISKPDQQCYFPMSMAMLYGPLPAPTVDNTPPTFPYNVTFKQGNYVPREDIAVGLGAESPQFDLILCLSTTKWLHLNWGDGGLKRAFRRMFNDLRPGGKLVLEAQNWASYKKKKRLTPTIYENFNSIEMFPMKFRDYLLSPEVGFSKCCVLGVPQHANKGFRRPIQLYVKGDFTPSQARWSDAHAPSSHHKPEASPARRPVYAPVAPAYRPSDDAPSCGAATPYSPNLDAGADDSPFYNPRSDSYAPSYEPPRPTVYATLGSPVGVPPLSPASPASPAPSPAPSPPEPRGARVYAPPSDPPLHE